MVVPSRAFRCTMITVLASAGVMAISGWSFAGSQPQPVVLVPPDNLTEMDRTAEAMITEFEYDPSELTIKAGTTVVWTNRDRLDHDVLVVGSKSPSLEDVRSDLVNLDERIAMTFNEPGTYIYICSVHPFMQGSVIVEPMSMAE